MTDGWRQHLNAILDLLLQAGEGADWRDLHTWGTPRAQLAEDLAALAQPVVALDPSGKGVFILDAAPDKARAWAWGPAVTGPPRLADALLETAVRELPPGIARISAFPLVDSQLEAWWRARGARACGRVHIYRAQRGPLPDPPAHLRRARPDDLQPLARLHDAAFPATYLSAAELLAGAPGRELLVADTGSGLAGYICAEARSDGTGYIHFLAVDPNARRRGLGRELLVAALHWLYTERGLGQAFLTVAEDNDARHLYGQAGFSLLATGQTVDLHLAELKPPPAQPSSSPD